MFRLSRNAGLCLLLPLTLLPCSVSAQQTSDSAGASATDVIARIKDEGLNHSQVMQTLSYLTDVIGPRLTGSSNLKRANEWTRDTMTEWGLQNAHLEAWGPFGRGWELERFSAQIISPQAIPLIAFPKAWSPGLKGTHIGEVVYLDAKTPADLEKYRGRLKGAIVLNAPIRDIPAHFTAPGSRYTDEQLQEMEAATAAAGRRRAVGADGGPPPAGVPNNGGPAGSPAGGAPTDGAANGGRPGGFPGGGTGAFAAQRQQLALASRKLQFCLEEGAAMLVDPGTRGDGGTLFVQQATVPQPLPPTPDANAPAPGTPVPSTATPPTTPGTAAAGTTSARARGTRRNAAAVTRISPWDKNAPRTLPQMVVSVEQYNRLVRMITQGEKLKMAVDLDVKFTDKDPMAYNTVAEIPGSDLKDQLVMLGGHMDSWHSGTGATDNGAGVAVCMEAVRILKALHLQPRRTVRIALWSGEEEGLYGSRAYVSQHFASRPAPTAGAAPGAGGPGGGNPGPMETKPEYAKLSGYFNLDNGTGKIRGIYLQGNEAVRPIFREWLAPFKDMGASTITIRNTGGTDHQSFDGVGLPGFQFIQDTIEYDTRTHHSNQDVYDRVQADDMKQAAIIMAAFVYNTAMRDEMLPRKPQPAPTPGVATAATR